MIFHYWLKAKMRQFIFLSFVVCVRLVAAAHGNDPIHALVVAIACPDSCHCPSEERVDCSALDLQRVPGNISGTTTQLLLSQNRLVGLSSECFDACPLIRTLDLQKNRLSDEGLTDNAFASLITLNHLYLAENRLRQVPKGLPDSLITLNLAGNEIKRIDPNALALNRKLRHLYLHDNLLSNEGMRRKVFGSLSHLEEVTLSDNVLSEVPPLPKTSELIYLQNNGIRRIADGAFRRVRNARLLFLQKNKISDEGISRRSFAGLRRIEYLDLSDNNLTRVPTYLPSKLKRVHLERNRIANLTMDALSRLKVFDTQWLLFFHAPKLWMKIDNRIKAKLFCLHWVENALNRNSLLAVLMASEARPDNTGKRLCNADPSSDNVISNDASAILISEIVNFRDFSTTRRFNEQRCDGDTLMLLLRRVEYLLLHQNNINSNCIEAGAFSRLFRLHTLHLFRNQLTTIPAKLPKKLQVLVLLDNRIASIEPSDFNTSRKLRELDIRFNRLTNSGISRGSLRKLKFLEKVDFSGNKLRAVPVFPRNVTTVVLASNHIYRIPPFSLARIPLLEHLYLSGNRLSDSGIPKNVFQRNSQLKTLDLSENNLTSVPANLPVNLEHLNLRGNKIESISKDAFVHTPHLKVIHLQDNYLLPETVSRAAFLHLRYLQRIDITWRPRKAHEKLPHVGATERRKREIVDVWRQDVGFQRELCSREVLHHGCLAGKVMIWPNKKRRRKVH